MKIQTAFRLDKNLLEALKIKAKAENRSLSNYIEYILYKVVDIPNEQTKKAIYEAENNINLSHVEDLDVFLKEL